MISMVPYDGPTMISGSRKLGMDNKKQSQKNKGTERKCQLNSFSLSDVWVHCMGSIEYTINAICPTTWSSYPKKSKKIGNSWNPPNFSVLAFFSPKSSTPWVKPFPLNADISPRSPIFLCCHVKIRRCALIVAKFGKKFEDWQFFAMRRGYVAYKMGTIHHCHMTT